MSGNQVRPSVTALSDGGFVVTWESWNQDGSGYGVYGQRYDADGTPQGTEFLINTRIEDDQKNPSVTALSDGGFVVAWESEDYRDEIHGQRYDAQGDEFKISARGKDDKTNPSVTGMSDGRFVVAWQSLDDDNGGSPGPGIYSQLFTPSGVAIRRGSDRNDEFYGTKQSDHMEGLAGNDWLRGRDGADTLDGGAGNDWLAGGAGADVFVFNPANGARGDTIADFQDGTDLVRILCGSFFRGFGHSRQRRRCGGDMGGKQHPDVGGSGP